MLKTLAYATLFSTALIGPSAYGADNAAAPTPAPQAQTQAPTGVTFVTRQEKAQWRAPKLIGVGVYGSDGKEIGRIDDLMMDHNGAAQTAVIGVGGFLGIGKKDVGVPFSALQWQTESRKVPAATAPPANPVASTTTTGSGEPPMKQTDPAATEAIRGYPDKAVLNVTLAELKAAPDFNYAESTLSESDMRTQGTTDPMKKTNP